MNTTTSSSTETVGEYEYRVLGDQYYRGCTRCGGSGHYSFDGFSSVCYACGNTPVGRLGVHVGDRADAEKDAERRRKARLARDAKREAKRLAKLAHRQEAWDRLAAEHPDVWELVSKAADVASFAENREQSITERDPFVRNLADQLWRFDERQYTDRQIAALKKVIEKRAVVAEHSTPAPEGRTVITGEIVSAKVKTSDFGVAYKIVVKDDNGFRVYATLPKKQSEEAYDAFLAEIEANGSSIHNFGPDCFLLGTADGQYTGIKGRRITFAATLKPSTDDPCFAFGSNPTKGAWL